MKLGRVYIIVSVLSQRVYVGSTTKTFEERWKSYKSLTCKTQTLLYRSLKKYGIENHIFHKAWEGDITIMLKVEAKVGRLYNVLDSNFGLNCKLPKESDKYYSVNKETRQRISKSKKGQSAGDKNYFFGKKGELSPMFVKTGEKHHNFGKAQSKEWIENNANSRKRALIQYSLNGEFIKEWSSIKEAGETLKIARSNISFCLKKENRCAHGFKWKYKLIEE